MGARDEFNEGLEALGNGELLDAKKHFEASIKVDPRDYNAWLYIGIVKNELEDYQGALAAFKQCMAIDDSLPHAYSNAGIVYEKLRDLPESLRHLVKAAKLDPADINTRLNLGMAFLKTRNKEMDALAEFKYVLEHDDSIADAWHHLGLIFMDLSKKPFALHCFEMARKLGFSSPKNSKLVVDLKFDGIAPKNPFDPDVKESAFLPFKKIL